MTGKEVSARMVLRASRLCAVKAVTEAVRCIITLLPEHCIKGMIFMLSPIVLRSQHAWNIFL